MRVDMHMHTNASDGTWTAAELVENVVKAGVELFAVTDHDSVSNIEQTADLAADAGLRFIPGVEVNSHIDGKNVHILGYGMDIRDRAFLGVLSANKDFLAQKDLENIGFLAGKGFPVDPDEYDAYEYDRRLGGWKMLNYCLEKGLCDSIEGFFDLFDLLGGMPFDPSGFVAPSGVLSAIKDAGGIAVLAHPGAKIYDFDYKALVERVAAEGIDGIECFHTEHDETVTRYCIEFCRKNGLRITAGSDCHGTLVAERSLGRPEVYLDQLDLGNLA